MMKWQDISSATLVLTVLIALPCSGQVRSRTDITYSTPTDGESGPKYLSFAVPTPSASGPTAITYAELQFQAELGPGVEVELWKGLGEESKPWEVDTRKPGCLWITDETTGGFVRFDVTDTIRGWLNGDENHGFLIRLVPGQDAKNLILASEPEISLRYHEVSVR